MFLLQLRLDYRLLEERWNSTSNTADDAEDAWISGTKCIFQKSVGTLVSSGQIVVLQGNQSLPESTVLWG